MSKEEIILRIKKLNNKYIGGEHIHTRDLEAIEGLYNLYIKEKEKNEKLKNQAKMSAEEHIKAFGRTDKMIKLLIKDIQLEGCLTNMTEEEIYIYYEKRIEREAEDE